MVFVICEYKAKKKVTLISHLAYATIVAKARNREKKKEGTVEERRFGLFFSSVLGCCQGASEQQRQSYSGEGVCEYMLLNPSPVLLVFFFKKRTLKKKNNVVYCVRND